MTLYGLSISRKIWAGFGFVLLLLQLLAIMAILNGRDLQVGFARIVNQSQPTLLDTLELQFQMEESAESLALYLLTSEPGYKQSFLQTMEKNRRLLEHLQIRPDIRQDEKAQALLAKIEQGIMRFHGYQQEMLQLAEDTEKNLPGQAVASNQLSPLGEQLRDLVAMMVVSINNSNLELLNEPPGEEQRLVMLIQHDIDELRYLWANVMLQVRGYLNYRDSNSLGNLRTYIKQVPVLVEKIRGYDDALPFELVEDIDSFDRILQAFQQPLERMITVHGSERWRTDAWLLREKVGPLLSGIEQDLHTLSEYQQQRIRQINEDMLSGVENHNIRIILLDVALVILGLLVAWWISGQIKKRLQTVVDAMDEVAVGDGNLSRRLDESGHDEMSHLATGFNRFVHKIKGVVDLVIESSTSLAGEARAMSTATNKTKQGAILQQSDTQQMAEAIGQMSLLVEEITRHADAAIDCANAASEKSVSGQRVVKETIEAINTLAGEVSDAAEEIQMLEQESESIDEVLSVIREITDQTNLLALNAAIEAARAGEQGRGFAVVADEVRNLAIRTQQGTQNIQKRIEQFKAHAGKAVVVMQKSRDRASDVTSKASQAGEALEGITLAVNTINEMNNNISTSTASQAAVAVDINQRIVTISQIAEQTATDAVATSASSNELSLMAGQLKDLVMQFLIQDKSRISTSTDRESATEAQSDEGDVTLF